MAVFPQNVSSFFSFFFCGTWTPVIYMLDTHAITELPNPYSCVLLPIFETGSHYVAWVGFEHLLHLPLPPKRWRYK